MGNKMGNERKISKQVAGNKMGNETKVSEQVIGNKIGNETKISEQGIGNKMENKLSSIEGFHIDAAYEVSNGMTGMKRDLVLRLCVIMKFEPKNIRSIFGMSKEHMMWKIHQYFVSHRKKCDGVLVAKFLKNENMHVANTGSRVVWMSYGSGTFAVDTEITKGVYGITIERDGAFMLFGLASKESLCTLATSDINSKPSGTCCIDYDGIYCGWTRQVYSNFFPHYGKATMRAELDADTHVLYFFVGGAHIPHSIVDVPSAVHFAVSGTYTGSTMEIKSVTKLRRLTFNTSLKCAAYKWKL